MCDHIIVHGRSRMTGGLRIPIISNDGKDHVGFSTTGQTAFAPNAKLREVFGELQEGCVSPPS